MDEDRLITIAIYTYEKAQIIKGILENEDIPVAIQNVNLIQPVISSGVRVRIRERDLPHALQILIPNPNYRQYIILNVFLFLLIFLIILLKLAR